MATGYASCLQNCKSCDVCCTANRLVQVFTILKVSNRRKNQNLQFLPGEDKQQIEKHLTFLMQGEKHLSECSNYRDQCLLCILYLRMFLISWFQKLYTVYNWYTQYTLDMHSFTDGEYDCLILHDGYCCLL
jgi:hypothetical protein